MRTLLLALPALFFVTPIAAGEPPAESRTRIALPHAAVSLEVAADWVITQFDGAVIDLKKDGARLWVYRGQKGDNSGRLLERSAERVARDGGTKPEVQGWNLAGTTDAGRVWYDTDSEHRMLGALTRTDESTLSVEALVPLGETTLLAEVRRMTDSFDINPFEHPERLVHWQQDWTLDLDKAWAPVGTARDFVRLGRTDALTGFDGYVRRTVIKAQFPGAAKALEKFKDHRISAPKDLRITDSGAECHYDLIPAKPGAGTAKRLWTRTHKGVEAILVHPWSETPADTLKAAVDEAMTMFRTLRPGADPGPQRDASKAGAPTRFPGKGGPALTFTFPATWGLGEPSNEMRLADFRIPGTPVLLGAVYWFGAGQGGTVEQNMERWTRQMESDTPPETPKSEAIAEGLRATTLDVTGRYLGRPAGHGTSNSKANQRMLATVLEVPEGKVFLKLVGDATAVGKALAAYHAWVKSFRVAK